MGHGRSFNHVGVGKEQENFPICFEVFLEKFSIFLLALLKGQSGRARHA